MGGGGAAVQVVGQQPLWGTRVQQLREGNQGFGICADLQLDLRPRQILRQVDGPSACAPVRHQWQLSGLEKLQAPAGFLSAIQYGD